MSQNDESRRIELDKVSFFYADVDEDDPGASSGNVTEVFRDLTVTLPGGVVSLVGQNGTGKSTFLLLAGARLFPQQGVVRLFGRDTAEFKNAPEDPELEEERNRLVSFVYQNMEFETGEPVGDLMEFVLANGFHPEPPKDLLPDVQKAMQVTEVLDKRTQELSKGELQRVIVGFSLLYGSKAIMLDEPVFAVEPARQEQVFEYLMEYSRRYETPIYYSAHNLDLTRDYSTSMILFHKRGSIELGPTKELFEKEHIEKAYQVPWDMLHRKEHMFREMLAGRMAGRRGGRDRGGGEPPGGDGPPHGGAGATQ
ncbi:MAG: ATP-binding cassette domain-containing protein [Spirochaetota bacterium]